MIRGKTIGEALAISDQTIVKALGGLPPSKIHCSILAEKAIRAAVLDYQKKTCSSHPSPLESEGSNR
jgi:nitrogen fixation NifU-like protein